MILLLLLFCCYRYSSIITDPPPADAFNYSKFLLEGQWIEIVRGSFMFISSELKELGVKQDTMNAGAGMYWLLFNGQLRCRLVFTVYHYLI